MYSNLLLIKCTNDDQLYLFYIAWGHTVFFLSHWDQPVDKVCMVRLLPKKSSSSSSQASCRSSPFTFPWEFLSQTWASSPPLGFPSTHNLIKSTLYHLPRAFSDVFLTQKQKIHAFSTQYINSPLPHMCPYTYASCHQANRPGISLWDCINHMCTQRHLLHDLQGTPWFFTHSSKHRHMHRGAHKY